MFHNRPKSVSQHASAAVAGVAVPLPTPKAVLTGGGRFFPGRYPVPLAGRTQPAWMRPPVDMNSWWGRYQYYFKATSPMRMFTTQAQLSDSLQFIRRCASGATTAAPGSQQRLWEAITTRDSMMHPDTGEVIPLMMRRCFYLPSNLPIFLGMLLSPQTVGWITTWQVLNNGYSTWMNYCNRNASSSQSGLQMLGSLSVAIGLSTTIAVRVRMLMDKVAHRPWAATVWGRALTQAVVPFVAMATSGTINLVMARYGEALDGIEVRDEHGNAVGRSVLAGRDAVGQTVASRVLMPLLPASIPPLIMHGLQKYQPHVVSKFGRMVVIKTAVVSAVCLLALPFSLAPFPYCVEKDVSELEPEFAQLRSSVTGLPITKVYYNRGL